MNAKRIFFVMIGAVVILVGLSVALIVYGDKMLKKQSNQLIEAKLEDRVVEEQQALVAGIKKDIAKYSELEAIAKAIVPQDKDQAKTVRELNQIADSSGVKLRTITFSASNLGNPQSTSTSSDDTKTTTAAPSQLKPAEGIQGVYTLEINISSADNVAIPYGKFIEFLTKLESNRRTAHVNKLVVTPQSNGVSFNITLNAYVKP